jgi:hypothetical protein
MPRDDVSEVPMEVDEPAAGPTTPKKSILPSTPPRVSISETAFQTLHEVLSDIILPTSEDDRIQRRLRIVWYIVHEALSQDDETMNTRLADEGQFLENVNEIGMGSFIHLLRDMARRQSWRDLLENGTYCLRLISSTLIVPCFQPCFSRIKYQCGTCRWPQKMVRNGPCTQRTFHRLFHSFCWRVGHHLQGRISKCTYQDNRELPRQT